MEAELEKLEANLGGVADMKRQPDAVFVIDLKKEQLAVARRVARRPDRRARGHERRPRRGRLRHPGNDDAIRSCNLVAASWSTGIEAGRTKVTPAEMSREVPEEPSAEQARQAPSRARPELETAGRPRR